MIRVFVRDLEGERQGFLGEFSPSEIPQLPTLFQDWATILDSDDQQEYVCSQFIVKDGNVSFEIVVGGD